MRHFRAFIGAAPLKLVEVRNTGWTLVDFRAFIGAAPLKPGAKSPGPKAGLSYFRAFIGAAPLKQPADHSISPQLGDFRAFIGAAPLKLILPGTEDGGQLVISAPSSARLH